MIADDSQLLRTNFRKLLEGSQNSFEISESGTVAETLLQLRSAEPDVLVLDIQLPDGSGFDVLDDLSATGCTSPPLVIVFTNFPSDQNRRRSLELGARYFFDKSNEFEQLIELLEGM